MCLARSSTPLENMSPISVGVQASLITRESRRGISRSVRPFTRIIFSARGGRCKEHVADFSELQELIQSKAREHRIVVLVFVCMAGQ